MDFKLIVEQLKDTGDLFEYEPMSKHTTFRIGGNARLFIEVKDVPSLKTIMQVIQNHNIPYYVIGRGSNVLFGDDLFEGIIISFNKYFTKYEVENNVLKAQCGCSMIPLALALAKAGYTGFEFASGIPGNIGGLVFMNAGLGKFGEIKEQFIEGLVMDENGNIFKLSNEQMEFSYRTSILQSKPWILLEATFKLGNGDCDALVERIKNMKQKRIDTQPLDKPNAGSTFRNPDGQFAWKLIDECGLRGESCGDARVSLKHSNFIVNEGNATCKDVLDLIHKIQCTVKEKFNCDLHTEVRMMNHGKRI